MSDHDVRAAVNYLRRACADPAGPLYVSDLVPAIDDVTTAWLADHPADLAISASVLAILVRLYRQDAPAYVAVSSLCDETLDRSGRLLGVVRERAALGVPLKETPCASGS